MTGTDISALYREFTDALTEVLAETAGSLARRGRLARAHAAVKRHPEYSEHEYFLAVETAFTRWEALQNVGR
jgi:predicted MarR family transcription regulator